LLSPICSHSNFIHLHAVYHTLVYHTCLPCCSGLKLHLFQFYQEYLVIRFNYYVWEYELTWTQGWIKGCLHSRNVQYMGKGLAKCYTAGRRSTSWAMPPVKNSQSSEAAEGHV
jgi:hypothetical protein